MGHHSRRHRWRSIAAQTGNARGQGWQVVKTRAYEVMTFTLAEVQADSLTAVIGGAGAARRKFHKELHGSRAQRVPTWSAPNTGTGRTSMAKLLQNMGATVAVPR